MVLDGGKHSNIVASTICEIEGALPLVKEGLLDEVSNGHTKIRRIQLTHLPCVSVSMGFLLLRACCLGYMR